ncbi:MAG: hypothetical protein ACYDDI_14110 [Candidatus Acidiferrales bacterium]
MPIEMNGKSQSLPRSPEQSSYLIYGLRFASDRPILGLIPIESRHAASPDLSVRFDSGEAHPAENPTEETLWYTSDIRDANGNPALKIWKRNNGDFSIRYSHGLTFHLNASLTDLSIHHDEPMSAEDVADFLLGPVLGIVLRLRGVTCLHASAVSVGGKAIAFVGVEGSGKSTTAALFAQKGHTVLSDDIVALLEREDSFYVPPAYPFLNLWPRSFAILSVLPCTVLPGSRTEEKRPLVLDDTQFHREELPLVGIYLLGERAAGSRVPFIVGLTPQDALMSLVANTYGNKALDPAMRAKEFSLLGRLVRLLPVRRVVANEDSVHLTRLYDVISADITS